MLFTFKNVGIYKKSYSKKSAEKSDVSSCKFRIETTPFEGGSA